MEKGQIVRRKVNNGTPVGPYMIIRGFIRNHVLTQRCEIGMESENVNSLYYAREHIYIPKIIRLIIQDAIWDRIAEGRQSAIIHDITPVWQKIYDTEPELIQLRSRKYPQKVMIYTVDRIADCYYNRTRQIRLGLGYRIL